MKIAILTANFPLTDTAEPGSPAVWWLVQGLKEQGHEVLVCTVGKSDGPELLDTTVGGVRVVAPRFDDDARKTSFDGPATLNVLSWQISRARLIAERCGKAIEEFAPDVIESQEFNGLGFFIAAKREFPFVIRCHGPMAHLMRAGFTGTYPIADTELVEAMELAPLALADGLIAMCNDIADRLAKLTGRSVKDWDFIRAPFRLSIDDTAVSGTEEATAPPTLFFFGRVDKLKGADLLVDAYIELRKKFADLQLIVAGPETVEEGDTESYASKLRDRLQVAGLMDQVKFLGYLRREEIQQLVPRTTVCVFPSRYETCCYACLEAIDYGGVAVAAKAGGLADYHEHGKSAWLVEADDLNSLTQGLDTVLSDSALRQELRAHAREYIKRICDPQTIAQQSIATYEKAIAHFQQRKAAESDSGGSGERAFKLFAQHLMLSLNDKPIWAQYPSQSTSTQPPTTVSNVIKKAARATKRLLAGH